MQTMLRASCSAVPVSRSHRHGGRARLSHIVRVASADETVESRERKAGPLARGGTLAGELAAGKDASPAFKAAVIGATNTGVQMQIVDGCFRDDRWQGGRWVLSKFQAADGTMDWDAVIDVEIARRKLLEVTPIPSTNEEPVLFDTSEIPWWAWVRRFHLPVAEKMNGRAAMVGYFLALVVDQLTGAGLLDQQNSFFGKVALHIVVFGVLLVRNTKDLDQYKNLLDEATFYDRQWQATWDGITRPSEKEKS